MKFLVLIIACIAAQSLTAQVVTDSLINVSQGELSKDPQSVSAEKVLADNSLRLLTSKGVYIVNYIASKFNYPDVALEEEISGTILVEFIVEKDGAVKEINVIQKLCDACDAEAVRVIKSTTYQPFIVNNEPQRVRYRIPVRMMLE